MTHLRSGNGRPRFTRIPQHPWSARIHGLFMISQQYRATAAILRRPLRRLPQRCLHTKPLENDEPPIRDEVLPSLSLATPKDVRFLWTPVISQPHGITSTARLIPQPIHRRPRNGEEGPLRGVRIPPCSFHQILQPNHSPNTACITTTTECEQT